MKHALVLLLCLLTFLPVPRTALAGQKVPSLLDIGYVLANDLTNGGGEIVAFDTRSMQVLGRFPEPLLSESPEILVSRAGDRLFVSEDRTVKGGKGTEHDIDLLEPRGGKLLAVFSMPDRVRYIGPGPGTMVISPDGSRLFVYSFRDLGTRSAAYWLSVVNLVTLTVSTHQISLSGCGPAYFATARRWVVAMCNGSNDIRFIDPKKLTMVKRVPLPSLIRHGVTAFLVPRSGDRLYVVTTDLRIVILGTRQEKVLKTITSYRQESRTVPQVYAAAMGADDRQLFVGALDRPQDTASGYTLHPFYVPSLKSGVPNKLPYFTHFVASPAGGLFTFPMGDSADRDWRIGFITPGSGPVKSAVTLHGPVIQLAIPGAASPTNIQGGI